MIRIPLAVVLFAASSVVGCARQDQPAPTPSSYYEIVTPAGRMVAHLFEDTPRHYANFARLVDEAFFDSTTFHRVIDGFMIQGGDPNSRDANLQDDGSGGPDYTIPAEIAAQHHHQRGAIAAARQSDAVNPERASNGSQFYIVHGGTPIPGAFLDQLQQQKRATLRRPDFAYSDEARSNYATSGGAPHLDGEYTVFGELVEGLDVLDAIASANTLRKRMKAGDPTLPNEPVDQALVDQPPQRIWMVVRPLPEYTPKAP